MREANDDTLIATVATVLEEEGCRFALIGAMAMLAHDAPRATLDIDLLTTEARMLDVPWQERLPAEVKVDIRRGDHDDPLASKLRERIKDLPERLQRDCETLLRRWEADPS